MRQRFAKAFGEPEDKRIPAKEYIEKKLAEVEAREFRAETLGEILSRDEVDPDVLVPHWDAKGHLSVKKGSSYVALPTTMFTGYGPLKPRGAMIPPWTLVLGYEHAIRKFANKLVSQEGYKLGEALQKAWKDATIKERHFISPLSLYGKRTAEAPPAPPTGAERPGKGGKKGGKKGAKSTKGQPTTYQSGKGSSRTPDNHPICFPLQCQSRMQEGC